MVCVGIGPSAVSELAWLVDLLVQTAGYAEPALDELDRSLLPGIAAARTEVRQRLDLLWGDSLAGCPEMLVAAAHAGCLEDTTPRRFLGWLSTLPSDVPRRRTDLLSEPSAARRLIRARLHRLGSDVKLRRGYRDVLSEVWSLASPGWQSRGRAAAERAAAEWRRRLTGSFTPAAIAGLMPPRHPLSTADTEAVRALLARRRRFGLAPVYFCLSGGHAVDTGDQIHIGVPASALEGIRRARDASFVADRLRLLSEPTRVRILIQVLAKPMGVMELSRALRISQPTVSGHVRALVQAGLLRPQRRGGRTVLAGSPRQVDRLIEDARATLGRWA